MEPKEAWIINEYKTKNLNKAAYLLINGAVYKDCRVENNNPIGNIVLDNVNKRHVDEFWKDNTTVELWTFLRMRKWLKDRIGETLPQAST